MCLVQTPVAVTAEPPFPYGFNSSGETREIPIGLRSLVGQEHISGRGFTFLKVVTQGKDASGNFTPFTQGGRLYCFRGHTRNAGCK